jgi:hypothetical protein
MHDGLRNYFLSSITVHEQPPNFRLDPMAHCEMKNLMLP